MSRGHGMSRGFQRSFSLFRPIRFNSARQIQSCLKFSRKRKRNKVTERKLSVRGARMELAFAMVDGDKDKIAKAQARLAEALAQRERKRREAEGKKNGFSKAS